MPNPWVSLRRDQLILANKVVNKKEHLEKGLEEEEKKISRKIGRKYDPKNSNICHCKTFQDLPKLDFCLKVYHLATLHKPTAETLRSKGQNLPADIKKVRLQGDQIGRIFRLFRDCLLWTVFCNLYKTPPFFPMVIVTHAHISLTKRHHVRMLIFLMLTFCDHFIIYYLLSLFVRALL
jgi:hypothetical protein